MLFSRFAKCSPILPDHKCPMHDDSRRDISSGRRYDTTFGLSTQIERHIGQKVVETAQSISHSSPMCRDPNVGDYEVYLVRRCPTVVSILSGKIDFFVFECCKKLVECRPKLWLEAIQMWPVKIRIGVPSAGSCFWSTLLLVCSADRWDDVSWFVVQCSPVKNNDSDSELCFVIN